MSLIDLKVQHHQTHEVARERLALAVDQLRAKFGPMVRTVDWAPDRESVVVAGPGFRVDFRVDATQIHVKGDLPIIASLMGGASGVRKMIESTFQKSIKP